MAEKEPTAKRIAVAISGGGHRAALFGLGALLYLVDAGKNHEVKSIASVSGGSLTNGFVAQSVPFADRGVERERFDQAVRPLVHVVAQQGSVLPPSPLTLAYLVVLLLVAVGAIVGVWFLPWPTWARVVAFALGLAGVGVLLNFRGWITAQAFAHRLFSPRGHPTQLSELHPGVSHLICAADLHAGENVYFSRDFVVSSRFGWGVPGSLALHVAVQASAALPGAFPPRWLRTSPHRFEGGSPEARSASRMCLVDGGVYDNMADQWVLGLLARQRRFPGQGRYLQDVDELIVVNASGSLGWGPTWRVRLPLAGEFLALLKDKSVLYDNGNSVRRELLLARFDQAALTGFGYRGALVHIPRDPFWVPTRFRASGDPDVRARAVAALALLEPERERLVGVAQRSRAVRTSLSKLGTIAAADLLEHGYVLAMANLHVILGYPLLPLPERTRFEELAR